MSKHFALLIAVLFLLVTSVRPAHADGSGGTSNPTWTCQASTCGGPYTSTTLMLAGCKSWQLGLGAGANSYCFFVITPSYQSPSGTFNTHNSTDGHEQGPYGVTYAAGTSCTANSTGTAPACSCSAGYAPSNDGSTFSGGSGALCIPSTSKPEPKACYKDSMAGTVTVCTSDGACTGATCYPTPAAACSSNQYTDGGQTTSCTLVQGKTCVCSTSYSDGSPSHMSSSSESNATPCPAGDTTCGGAAAAAKEQNTSAAAAGAAAGAASAAAGGTLAQQAAAASAAITAANSAPTAGASAANASNIASQLGPSFAGTGTTPTPSPLDCDLHPTHLGCAEFGTAPTAETASNSTPTFSSTPVLFAGASGCPAPFSFTLTMPYFNRTYYISVQPFCDMAATLQPIFLALAAITAAFIFAGVLI